MSDYDTKGVLLSIGAREALGKRAGSDKKGIRESNARVRPAGEQKTTRGSCWPDPRVTRFPRAMT